MKGNVRAYVRMGTRERSVEGWEDKRIRWGRGTGGGKVRARGGIQTD